MPEKPSEERRPNEAKQHHREEHAARDERDPILPELTPNVPPRSDAKRLDRGTGLTFRRDSAQRSPSGRTGRRRYHSLRLIVCADSLGNAQGQDMTPWPMSTGLSQG